MATFKLMVLVCCIATVCSFYQLPYQRMYPAYGPFAQNYNPRFVNPFVFDDDQGNEEDDIFAPDDDSLEEFQPVKRSDITIPIFHDETAVKRDLIKGPSFQPNINENDAASDLANENKEAIETLLAKRKDIFQPNNLDSDDEEIQGTDSLLSNTSVTSPSESPVTTLTSQFLNGIQNDINKVRNQVTKHVVQVDLNLPTSANEDEPNKQVATSSSSSNSDDDNINKNDKNDVKENLETTKNLIGLLYDFNPSSAKPGESEKSLKEKAIAEYMDGKEDFDASDDFLKSLKDSKDVTENSKRADMKKGKRKIDVTVNVNINEKAMKKSNVAPKPTEKGAKRARVVAKTHASNKSEDEDEDVDDEDEDESEEKTPTKASSKTNAQYNKKPTSTLSRFSSPQHSSLKTSGKNMKKVAEEDEDDEEDEGEDEDDDDEDSGSGSTTENESKTPFISSFAEKAKHALETIRHKMVRNSKKHAPRKQNRVNSESETAKAEEGEIAADNVKVNKLAANLEQKQNELEHNDEQAEPLSAFHSKAKKLLNKEEAEEVRETTRASTSESKDLGHEAFIHNVKSGNAKSGTAEDVRIEQLSGKTGEDANSQPSPETPGLKQEADKKDETNEAVLKKSSAFNSQKVANPENITDMTLEEVREKFKKWEHKVKDSGVEASKQTESPSIESVQQKKDVESEQQNDARLRSAENSKVETTSTKQFEEEEPSKKEKLLEDEDDAITRSANDAFTKVVNTITTPKDLQELHNHQDSDVKEVSASAEKAFSHVVDNVMKGKDVDSEQHGHELKKLDSPSIGNLHLEDANLEKLKSFKSQILSEVEKINKLQAQYGKDSKGAKDLNDARSVLQKDLNVVKDLEGRLKNRKNKLAEQEVMEHDKKNFGRISDSKQETIPDAKLGFTHQSKTTKKTHTKSQKTKIHKGGKKHPLEEIHSLLKAEIKRLKLKKNGRPDAQLNSIRKMVQKKLKNFIKSGEIGKEEFKTLAPEIKELGSLLKHRINSAKKFKGHRKEEDLMIEAKKMEKDLGTGKEGINKAEASLSNAPRPEELSKAQNVLERLQASNNSAVSSQSLKMKTLLTSLNQKLGQIFSKANTVQQGSPQGFPQQSNTYQGAPTASQPPQMQQISGFQPDSPPLNIPNQFSPTSQRTPQRQQAVLNPQAPQHVSPLAKAETPEPDFEPDETRPIADDEPVDTLIEALERDITEVWSYRNMFPDAESLGLDNEKVHNAYANLGSLSGLSLRRALDRALRGEDVGLAVVGGSISKGGPFSEKGLDYVLKSYFYAIEDYWNKVIRPVTGSSLIVRDVSIGGISTDYYSYCLRNHLPDDKLTNIVLWELSANDMKRYDDSPEPKTEPLEQFTRNVISYRAKPALIYVNFFANFDWDPEQAGHCRNFEDEGEDVVAKYYKITSLSWRNMVCPEIGKGQSQIFTRDNLFAEDKFHPSIHGHAQVAYLTIDYIRTEFLKNLVKMRKTNIADAVTRLQIPRTTYVPRPLYPQTASWKPLCYTYMVVDDKQANNSLPLEASPSGSFQHTVVREFKIRSDKIVGMNTLDKDQYLRFDIHLPPHPGGSIKPYKKLGIMSFTDDRKADVQFDAEPPMMIETSKRFLEGTTMKYIAKDIRPGNHALSIRSGDNGFLVCAIVVA